MEVKRRGRPPRGLAPLPAAARLAMSKARLEQQGGRRLTLNLGPQAAEDLLFCRIAWGQPSDRAAIELALRQLAEFAQRRRE